MDEHIKNRRTAQMLRKQQTKEENHLWYDFLKTYPIQFKRQYPVGCYYVDFYCYRAGVVVELDGSQHYTPQAEAYDRQRTAFLETQGLKVLRFSNSDVWKNFPAVCEQIDLEIRTRLG